MYAKFGLFFQNCILGPLSLQLFLSLQEKVKFAPRRDENHDCNKRNVLLIVALTTPGDRTNTRHPFAPHGKPCTAWLLRLYTKDVAVPPRKTLGSRKSLLSD